MVNLPQTLRCLYNTGKSIRMAEARQVALCSTVFLLLLLPTHSHGFSLSKRSEGPPVRPGNFRSVAELQKYLAELTDYYTVLGRPRFGKRSAPMGNDALANDFGLNAFKRRVYRKDSDFADMLPLNFR